MNVQRLSGGPARERGGRIVGLGFSFFLFCFFLFWGEGLFRAAPAAYGSSQASGEIGATAAGLHHSHSNTGSRLHLQPTPQLVAMPDN